MRDVRPLAEWNPSPPTANGFFPVRADPSSSDRIGKGALPDSGPGRIGRLRHHFDAVARGVPGEDARGVPGVQALGDGEAGGGETLERRVVVVGEDRDVTANRDARDL